MAEYAFGAAATVTLLVVLALWVLISFGSVARVEADGRPILGTTVLIFYGLVPVVFWFAGTHLPAPDYASVPRPTALQRTVGQISVVGLVLLLGVAAGYLLTRQATSDGRGRGVWLSYLAFAAGPVLAMVAGTRPGLRYELLFAPAALTVLYCSLRGSPDRWVILVGRLLLVYVWTSLVAAAVRPEWAFEAHARATLLLGTRPRLVGITASPNALGPVAAAAFLIVAARARGPWRVINGIAAGAAVIMTDSRMAVAGAVAGLLVMYICNREIGQARRTVLAVSVLALPLLLVASATDPMERLATMSEGSLSSRQVSTLGGRLDVWEQTLDEWRRNRLFGYGPALWSPEHRAQFGQRFNWVGQAHNQWIQTLGEAGLIGLAGLVMYIASLVTAALATLARSRGLTGALVALLLFRMLSESPLRNPGLDVVTLLHVVTFAVVLAYSRVPIGSPASEVAPRGDSSPDEKQITLSRLPT